MNNNLINNNILVVFHKSNHIPSLTNPISLLLSLFLFILLKFYSNIFLHRTTFYFHNLINIGSRVGTGN